jgi:alpha/beta superfamily hydrolase
MRLAVVVLSAVAAAFCLPAAAAPAARETGVSFPAAGGAGPLLAGMLALPSGGVAAPAVVICHPHPRGGGSMDVPIVKELRDAFVKAGFVTLRFDFRGVGSSGGTFTGGGAEVDDALGALAFLRRRSGVDPARVALVGYSFGAAVALEAAVRDGAVPACACLALPVRAEVDPATGAAIGRIAFPTVFVAGTEDPVCRLDALAAAVRAHGAGRFCRIEPVPGADHVFAGVGQRGIALKRIVRFVSEAVARPAVR